MCEREEETDMCVREGTVRNICAKEGQGTIDYQRGGGEMRDKCERRG